MDEEPPEQTAIGYFPRALALVAENLLDLSAKRRGDIVARERIGDIRGEETDLRAAVETLTLELEAVEALQLGKRDHGVGELDFAAGAALLLCQNGENLRLKDVTAGDDEIGRRFVTRWLFHHFGDLERFPLGIADPDHAIHVDPLRRHFLH